MDSDEKTAFAVADLKHWKLIPRFREKLMEVLSRHQLAKTWEDPKRVIELADYLSLFLFGLFNPVVRTMRGLCAASKWDRVQKDICTRPISLGSFSECQALVDPQLLRELMNELLAHNAQQQDGQLPKELLGVDSTVWVVLPRMHWANWSPQVGQERAIRLHLKFNLLERQPKDALMTVARQCERKTLREWIKAGEFYVGDRYYGEEYSLLGRLHRQGCGFVTRLREQAVWTVLEEIPLSTADRQAGVFWQAWVRLGKEGKGPRVRVVKVRGRAEEVWLVTNQPAEQLSAELIWQIYRYRWQVELYFRWIKCILGCRHWLAESQTGVALQLYLALIAAQVLLLITGQRPTRRQMEALQAYTMGWISDQELSQTIIKRA